MNKKTNKLHRFCLDLPTELYNKLDKYSDDTGTPIAGLVKQVLYERFRNEYKDLTETTVPPASSQIPNVNTQECANSGTQ